MPGLFCPQSKTVEELWDSLHAAVETYHQNWLKRRMNFSFSMFYLVLLLNPACVFISFYSILSLHMKIIVFPVSCYHQK